jgi:hypothetical protein
MTTAIASILRRKTVFDRTPRTPMIGFGAFDESGDLIASYPAGTSLDVALASAAYHDSGDWSDMVALLKLEARDGNADAANLLRKMGRDE